MNDLEEQLQRLATRGPVTDARFVVRGAMQRAADGDPDIARRHSTRRMASIAAGLLIVAGTAGVLAVRDDSGATSNDSTPAPTTSADAPTTTESPLSPEDRQLSSMMYALLDVPTSSEMVGFLAYNIPEAEVQTCMANAGFQYAPGPSPEQQLAADPMHSMPPAEFAAQYGFGVTAYDLGLLPMISDPNSAYIATLTAAEQESFFQWKASCGGMTPERVAYGTALTAAIDQIRAELKADARVVTALDGWRACMASAGYQFTDQMAMIQPFYTRMNSGISHAELEQLFHEEVATAVANVPCDAAYRATYRAVATDRFTEFRGLVNQQLAG